MQFNSILFPAPVSTYTQESIEQLVWIPRSRFFSLKTTSENAGNFEDFYRKPSDTTSEAHLKIARIPCHFEKFKEDCKNTIIYFHANAEDLGLSQSFARRIGLGLEANVLTVEYPGYGLYQGKPCVQTILEDAEFVYDFLIAEIGLKPENIMLLGRSLGSGPAIHLAANRGAKMLILVSPFTSIQDVVKDTYGSVAGHIVADKLKNLEKMRKIQCPCYFIHGQKDKLIHPEHSKRLIANCESKSKIYLPEDMTHNEFRVYADIIEPVRLHLSELDYKMEDGKIEFPEYSLQAPGCDFKVKKKLMSKIVTMVSKHHKY